MNHPRALYEFGDFTLDVGRQCLQRRGGDPIPLTGKNFDTLVYLVEHAGEPLDKEVLLKAIWPDVVVEENNLTQAISALRQLLGETRGENRYIATLPRKGYRFVATVARTQDASVPAPSSPAEPPSSKRAPRAVWIAVAGIALVAFGWWIAQQIQSHSEPQARTLAILPFKPLLPEQRNAALEFGMTDTLIAHLSQRSDRAVRPLSSVRRYDGVDQDALAAGRELQVDAVLDGSIQRDGERLRVSVRLLRVADGKQLWSRSFDQSFTDVFDVQDAIATRISDALPTDAAFSAPARNRDTENPEAYALYAAGRLAHARLTLESLEQALRLFEQAIALDPNYALAYLGVADCYTLFGVYGVRAPSDVHPKVQQAIDKALALDPNLAAAYTKRGELKIGRGEWDGAAQDLARALALDPNHANAYYHRGALYAMQGNHARSHEDFRRAQQLEPASLGFRARESVVYVMERRYDEAITDLRRLLDIDDRFTQARGFLVRALIAKGDYPAAMTEIERGKLEGPGSPSFNAQILALTGRRDEALAELARLQSLSKQRYVSPLDIAFIYAALKDGDNTIAWLERCIESKVSHGFVSQEPLFDFLRDDPRFAALVKRIGIVGRKLPKM